MEEFLRQKETGNPVGNDWIRRMRWELRRVPRLISETGAAAPAESVRELRAEQVLAIRRGMRWEKATFAIHFAALRQFLRWGKNPVADVPGVWRLPSGQPSHRRWLTRDQLGRLLLAAKGPEKLLVALEGLNGLRRIEVLRLRRKDVLLGEASLRVLGKGRDGGKWRQIPMHPSIRDIVESSIRARAEEDRLLAVSASTADQMLHRAARRAGFDQEGIPVSHHDLRRTFGRIAYEAGMDLVQLKNLLGHSSMEMTVHYIGLDSERMRRGLELVLL